MSLRDLVVSIDFDDIDIKKLLQVDDAMDEIEDSLQLMDGNLDDATNEFREMGRTGSRAMGQVENSTDEANDAMKDFNKGVDDGQTVLKDLKRVGLIAAGAIAGAFAGVAVFSTGAIKDAAQFDTKMREVFTLLPGVSEDAMGDMKEDVKEFSKEFGVLPNDVVPALYQSLSAGVPKDNVFAFMETAQKAAVGGVTELETAVDGITSVVNAYGEDVVDAAKASDVMFTAVKLGKTNFEELSNSLFNVLPNASAAGVAFEDVAAGVAALTAQGTPTSVATTRMRAAIDELNKSGTEVSDLFQELSGKSFKEFMDGGGDMQEALQMLEEHAKDSGLQIGDLFGSVEAAGAATALTGKGTEKFTSALEEMGQAAGATDAAFETMQGPEQNFKKWEANLATLRLEWGEKLLPIVNDFITRIIDNFPTIASKIEGTMDKAMDFYNAVIDNWPAIETTVMSLGAAVGSYLVIMKGLQIMGAINTLMIAYRSGTVAATLAQWGLNTAMLANPLTWIVAGIAALIGIGVLLVKNWDTVTDATGKLWSYLGDAWDGLLEKAGSVWEGIKGFFVGGANAVIDAMNGMIKGVNNIGFDVPDWVPVIGGKEYSLNIPLIPNIGGSHLDGLESVPLDGYIAELHKGEAVLTADQSNALRDADMLKSNGGGKPVLNLNQEPNPMPTLSNIVDLPEIQPEIINHFNPIIQPSIQNNVAAPDQSQIAPSRNESRNNNTFAPNITIQVERGENGQVDEDTIAQAVKREMEKFWIEMQLKEA